MAEAPIKWKVKILREIIAAPSTARFIPKPNSQEMDWFIDMEKDGYVEGDWVTFADPEEIKAAILSRAFPSIPSGPKGFTNLHVPEKGKKLVEDYLASTTFRGAWKRHHFAILTGILGIAGGFILAYLVFIYLHQ